MSATLESISQQIEKQKEKGTRLATKAADVKASIEANNVVIAELEKSYLELQKLKAVKA